MGFVAPAKLLRMDAKDVVQKAQQEMQHLKRHFLVVVLTDPEEPPKKVTLTLTLAPSPSPNLNPSPDAER